MMRGGSTLATVSRMTDDRELETDPLTIASMASFGLLMEETEVQALADSYLELREALEKYGRHLPDCQGFWDGNCGCGLSDALGRPE